ncbi:hypothetical protein ABE957_04420 [Halomonas sp. CS7]|uniref:Uncharacterized protein n=1 Tax=Halomonas pelophila TaxID=3151122 RepID=A0ABV1N2I5_9GAMM
MRRALSALTMAALAGCSSSDEPVTQEGLVQALQGADLGIVEVIDEDPNDSRMVPGEYQHHVTIVLEEVAPKGGQFFICNDPAECSEIKGYFDGLASLAGPHRYASESGRVVSQLNRGVSQETADQVLTVLEEM